MAAAKEPRDKAQGNAQDNACRQREVDVGSAPAHVDVAGQPSHPGAAEARPQDGPGRRDAKADDNEGFSKV